MILSIVIIIYSYFVLSLSVVNRVLCSASIFFLTCVWYGFSLKLSSLLHSGQFITPSTTNKYNNYVHVPYNSCCTVELIVIVIAIDPMSELDSTNLL